ncbi:MAG: carboxypeptidase regulatory-like domain-containing protein, partial [Planctomycetes bacterium]|nr:carboxypeptidase regulatory-like domain-containing protein [Planctomycetota bacterium]
MKRRFIIMLALSAIVSVPSIALAAGSITGFGQFEKIAGNPSMGYQQLYEWDLFLSPSDNSYVGPSRRLGAHPGQFPSGDGYYKIEDVPAGMYSIYVNQPDFFASPKIMPNVEIVNGQEETVNI